MKIQLDTTSKIIKVEETVTLGEFTELLERLLPNGRWKEFKLETQIITNWNRPIVIEPYKPFTLPWSQPWITYDTAGIKTYYSLNPGVYDIQLDI